MQIFRHELKMVYISKHEILSLYADFLTIKSYLRHVILEDYSWSSKETYLFIKSDCGLTCKMNWVLIVYVL